VYHVVSADTVNTFKHRLDKFWLNQEVKPEYYKLVLILKYV